MLGQLVPIMILFVFTAVFGAVLLFVTKLLGQKAPKDAVKLMPYECGVVGQSPTTTRIPIKFYLTAISFILFDIEVVFLYPWTLIYVDNIASYGGLLLSSAGIFVAILTYGLVYEWKAGALEWD